jgi:hypothetical protein
MSLFKSDPPPAPNYQPIAAASDRAAQLSYDMALKQLDWAKQQDVLNRATSDKVVQAALDRQATTDANAAKDRARYEQIYQPLEDKAAADALSYASPERQKLEMGRAAATVAQQFGAQRDAATRNLESFGVDPSSTRYAALDLGSRVQEGAAQAAAANQARTQTEAVGRALTSEAINVGRGYPGSVAGSYQTALASGAQAGQTGLATTASGVNSMGSPTQWMGAGNAALGTWGNALTSGYNTALSNYNANQQSGSALGSLIGLGIGMIPGLAEGGAVDVGGGVPPSSSPTRGGAVDDVPARLTVGEFVIPKDVALRKGHDFFERLVQKTRENANQPQKPMGGKPMRVPMNERPTFASSGAVPT